MALSKKQRDALSEDDFAVPEKRELPMHDEKHVRLAWDMVDRTQGLSDDEKATARSRILRKAKELGVSTKDWHASASAQILIHLESMALDMPDVPDHPNKHPFSGILTRLDTPSDYPVGGTTSKKVIIPREVAEKAIPSLLGMAIDYKNDFDGHNNKSKIGIITEAHIGAEDKLLGTPICISGFFYVADFPKEVAFITAAKDDLGFSYECKAFVQDLDASPWVCSEVSFTGAAVLYKDKAAFTNTSINATRHKGVSTMTPEEIAAMQKRNAELEAANKDLAVKAQVEETARLAAEKKVLEAASVQALVKPHAAALRQCAASMIAAGIGANSERGHGAVLNKMADHMEAQSILGKVPDTFDSYFYGSAETAKLASDLAAAKAEATAQKDLAASLQTKLTDAEKKAVDLAAAGGTGGTRGQRKSLSASGQAGLKKLGLAVDDGGKLTVADFDKAAQKACLSAQQSMALKLDLRASGAFA